MHFGRNRSMGLVAYRCLPRKRIPTEVDLQLP
jgi:hypothetical protein